MSELKDIWPEAVPIHLVESLVDSIIKDYWNACDSDISSTTVEAIGALGIDVIDYDSEGFAEPVKPKITDIMSEEDADKWRKAYDTH